MSAVYDPLMALLGCSSDENLANYIDTVNKAASTELALMYMRIENGMSSFGSLSTDLLASSIPRQLGGKAHARHTNSIGSSDIPRLPRLAVQASPVMVDARATLFRDSFRGVHRKDGM